MANPGLSFLHEFVQAENADTRTLLMLHGTGGNERDLLDVGHMLLPTAALLSPRGKVMEQGMPRFFRRLSEGVFDVPDLKLRAAELATFVEDACASYGRDPKQVVAVGFSNGANIAAGVMLEKPGILRGGVLLRAMVPFHPDVLPRLEGTGIFLAAGSADGMVSRDEVEQLAALFGACGASVELHWERAGHTLTQGDVVAAKRWLERGDW